jgi:hypothetical protein
MDETQVEEIKRHFGVVAEELRSEVRAVAEGVGRVDERLERLQSEVKRESEETRSLIRLSYSELERRVEDLEGDMGDLKDRVSRLEARL